ncbi:putative DNA ligase [Peziza echinospora]|nr:putative DNA ligase [Peziza echinospora]
MSDLDSDTELPDAPPPGPAAGGNTQSAPDIDESSYPNRPTNRNPTLPFHTLHTDLFEPLLANKTSNRVGGRGLKAMKPHEARRLVIERYVARWRKEVGDDVFPVFRLIMPDKDGSRTVYNLKEKTLAQLIIKTLKINKSSEDAQSLINWKLPPANIASKPLFGGGGGNKGVAQSVSGSAGDFAGRCYAVIKKRPMLSEFGSLTIDEVNELLDRLSVCSKEEQQLPIFNEFYMKMNAEEMMWVIRIILKQMKVGATEKTFFQAWHPDAENIFNVSSSLKRVCWELWEPNFRLNPSDKGVTLMSCFQPQLAQFQKKSLEDTVKAMRRGIGRLSAAPPSSTTAPENPVPLNTQVAGTTGEALPEFWIEEKLDGERMQMHMRDGEFRFWSRKAKDYTYLYGSKCDMDGEDGGSLTRYLGEAFHEGVRNIILDGEMITWDPTLDCIVAFGTLKTACLNQSKSPYDTNCQRPLFRVFDILYLNDKCLINYTLTDRRNALAGAVIPVPRRLEIHEFKKASASQDIEDALRKVVAEASEGLVIKNPMSMYCLNERNDDWMKVKPDYMTEFGEELDLLVVGGYFGNGKRGGMLSSFLCALRVDGGYLAGVSDGKGEEGGSGGGRWWSFCKVGGGMTASDYLKIQHDTEGKWKDYDPKRPPKEVFELAGGNAQFERPDQWIHPTDSVVIAVKAASVSPTDQFRMQKTLRFPRFKCFKQDKDWRSAMTVTEFVAQQAKKAKEIEEGAGGAGGAQVEMNFDKRRGKTAGGAGGARKKREINVIGQETPTSLTSAPTTTSAAEGGTAADRQLLTTPYGSPLTQLFSNRSFYVASDPAPPHGTTKTKQDLEHLIKLHGGKIQQSPSSSFPPTTVLADKRTVKVTALIRQAEHDILRTCWVFESISAGVLLPLEIDHHLLFIAGEDTRVLAEGNVDGWGDSYARELGGGGSGGGAVVAPELKRIIDSMKVARRGGDYPTPHHLRDQVMLEMEHSSPSPSSPSSSSSNIPPPAGWTLSSCVAYFLPLPDPQPYPYTPDTITLQTAPSLLESLGARVVSEDAEIDGGAVTHVIVPGGASAESVRAVRERLAGRIGGGGGGGGGGDGKIARVVSVGWAEECFRERTWVDEERWAVHVGVGGSASAR